MNKIGVVAFGITTSVLVPTALHYLQAGPNQVAKLIAPDEQQLKVGDAKIDISADKAIVDAGDKVRVTLSATSEKREKVTVAIVVLESAGSGGGRVDLPPDLITRQEITLDTANGKATKTLAYTLPGRRAEEMGGRDYFGHYQILVMPPKAADTLERLRRRAERVENPMEDRSGRLEAFEEAYGSLGGEDDKLGAANQVARLDINTRPTDSTVSIVAEDTAHAGDDITVKVRVTNPLKTRIEQTVVALSATPSDLYGEYKGISADAVTIDDNKDSTIALGPHESKVVTFHVHTKAIGTLGLFASARCNDDGEDCYTKHGNQVDDSVLDAIDILPVEKKDDDAQQPVAAAPAAPAPVAAAAAPTAPAAPAAAAAKPAAATAPAGTQ
jgi:hypothetical protein